MSQYDDLVSQLRQEGQVQDDCRCPDGPLMRDAANTIRVLEAANATLREQLDDAKRGHSWLSDCVILSQQRAEFAEGSLWKQCAKSRIATEQRTEAQRQSYEWQIKCDEAQQQLSIDQASWKQDRERAEAAEAETSTLVNDAELGKRVDGEICLRTHFTGEPPYVGNDGIILALSEVLDENKNIRAQLAEREREGERLAKAQKTIQEDTAQLCKLGMALGLGSFTSRSEIFEAAIDSARQAEGEGGDVVDPAVWPRVEAKLAKLQTSDTVDPDDVEPIV